MGRRFWMVMALAIPMTGCAFEANDEDLRSEEEELEELSDAVTQKVKGFQIRDDDGKCAGVDSNGRVVAMDCSSPNTRFSRQFVKSKAGFTLERLKSERPVCASPTDRTPAPWSRRWRR